MIILENKLICSGKKERNLPEMGCPPLIPDAPLGQSLCVWWQSTSKATSISRSQPCTFKAFWLRQPSNESTFQKQVAMETCYRDSESAIYLKKKITLFCIIHQRTFYHFEKSFLTAVRVLMFHIKETFGPPDRGVWLDANSNWRW